MVENAFLWITNLGIRGANKLTLLLFRYTWAQWCLSCPIGAGNSFPCHRITAHPRCPPCAGLLLECAQSCTVWGCKTCEYEIEKVQCGWNHPCPALPQAFGWDMPWDTAKDHPGMNSNCSSDLILGAPSECLFCSTSQLGLWTSTPGVALVFFICWIKISAAVTSCT